MARLAYLGTPEVAVPPLRALVADGHDVALVVTRADKRRGRGGAPAPSPVKSAAVELGIPVTTDVEAVVDAGVERGVVVAFGRLVKPHVLAAVPMVNVHFSLLPRWRGAAPVERAMLAGDRETGVCLMELEEGLDTGPVYACERVAVGEDETLEELRARLVDAGTRLLLDGLRSGLQDPKPQEGEATYAEKLTAEELRIDWERPAAEIHRLVRLGRAWTTFRGRRLRVLRTVPCGPPAAGEARGPGAVDGVVVECGEGRLELVEVQAEGKAAQPAAAWRNGARPGAEDRLGR